jgi:leader peptidase (prepilin peptidase)/N-methyltransferase
MIRILGTIFAGLLGLCFGSFLNVCLSRWPAGESVVQPRSHCRQCGRALAWWENIPLLSWLSLRGRCRSCKSWIGWRYPLVELAVGVLWAFFAWRSYNAFFPLEFAGGMMFFSWTIVGLAILDTEHFWLPDALTLPMIALGFLWRFFQEEQVGWALKMQTTRWEYAKDAISLLLGILAAAALILLIRWVYWLIRRREGIGLGDAKLMAMLAAWLGLPGALLAFGLGAVLGSLVALVLLLLPAMRHQSGKFALTKLPLGTFLCIGGIVSSLWGERLIDCYLRWAGF